MSKTQITIPYTTGTGVGNLGSISDLNYFIEELYTIKNIFLKELTVQRADIPKGCECCICVLFLATCLAPLIALNILHLPLGFLGIVSGILVGWILFLPVTLSKIRIAQNTHDIAVKIDELTKGKIRVTYNFTGMFLKGINIKVC